MIARYWPRKKKRGAPVVLFADPSIGLELARRIAAKTDRINRFIPMILEKKKTAGGAACL